MDQISMPELLDPDRMVVSSRGDLVDHDRQRMISGLEQAIRELCTYGQRMWNDLNAMRAYLLESLPPISVSARTATSPTGPDDEQGWQNWINAYAAITSVLTGPHGDDEYGWEEAHHEANLRRARTGE
jgi:hypothetical protein